MLEFYMGVGYVRFDGRVLEQWQPAASGPDRLHIAVIGEVGITQGRKGKLLLNVGTTYGAGNQLIPFHEQQRPWVDHLIAEIQKAKAEFAANR